MVIKKKILLCWQTNVLTFCLEVLEVQQVNLLGESRLKITREKKFLQFSSVQSLSRVRLFATPWTAACQPSLSITTLKRCSGQGPHLVMTGEPRGFARVAVGFSSYTEEQVLVAAGKREQI